MCLHALQWKVWSILRTILNWTNRLLWFVNLAKKLKILIFLYVIIQKEAFLEFPQTLILFQFLYSLHKECEVQSLSHSLKLIKLAQIRGQHSTMLRWKHNIAHGLITFYEYFAMGTRTIRLIELVHLQSPCSQVFMSQSIPCNLFPFQITEPRLETNWQRRDI